MASLKIKTGSRKEVKKGLVELEGSCVVLRAINPKSGEERLEFGYCLQPGETVTRIEEDDYIVEF
jgi:hypothetical protein